jgi:hypothetical protein
MDIGRVTPTGFPYGVRCATCDKRLRRWYAAVTWSGDCDLIICLNCATRTS